MRLIKHIPEPHDHEVTAPKSARSLALKRLRITLYMGIGLFLMELIGGWISGSLALLADSFHVLADLIAVAVTLLASFLAERPQSPRRSYGLYRIEVLAALGNGLILMGLSTLIIRAAMHRWASPAPIHTDVMIPLAAVGLVANLFMLLVLRPSHDHNLNMRGAYLHLLGDTLSSVGVVSAGIIIWTTGLSWIDPLASIFVAVMIIVMALRLVIDSAHVLLESTPKHLNPTEMQTRMLQKFPEIHEIHDFHIWEITSHLFAMTAHIDAKVENLHDSQAVTQKINIWVKEEYGIGHTTFQIEAVKKTT